MKRASIIFFLLTICTGYPHFLPLRAQMTSERDLPPRPKLDMNKVSRLIVKYTNKERKRHGLTLFKVDPVLNKAALIHSNDMARRGVMSHYGSKYRKPSDRVRAACPVKRPNCTGDYQETPKGYGRYLICCGENVIESAAGNFNGVGYYIRNDSNGRYRVWTRPVHWFNENELARDLVRRWMLSAPHRRNILTRKFVVIGTAIVWGRRERYFGTQIFGPLKDKLKKR